MEIYLIRHTTPLGYEGICYGQTDIPLAASFPDEAENVRRRSPVTISHLYSSPLDRCIQLAQCIYPRQSIEQETALLEMNFGEWECKPWEGIDANSLDTWMKDYVYQAVPGGESYHSLFQRTSTWWERTFISNFPVDPVVCVTHAGVIRSLLCHCTETPLENAFDAFPVPFGAVYRLSRQADPGKEKGTWEIRLL